MYLFQETVPANTAKDSPLIKDLLLDYGIIDSFLFIIPSGVCGLAGFKIYKGTTQLIPANLGQWITGDNLTGTFSLKIPLTETPYTLTAYLYNEDDTYDHTITFMFDLVMPWKPSDSLAIARLAEIAK